MLINLRNALMAGKRLPYDAEVECLESTGDQYINTGITPVDDATFVICAAFTDLTTGRFGAVQLVSVGGATSRYYFGVSNGKWIGAINSVSYNHDISQADTGIHVFKTNSLGLYIDDVMVVVAGDSKPTIPLYLANIDGSNTAIPTKAKLYSCKIYDANGVLIHDLIPVRKGTTGEMFDRVSGKFAERHGDFVLGPDVVPVEYIESHGTEYINTGIILNDTYGIDINFAPMETASGVSEHGIFGSSVSGSGIRHNVLQIHSSAGGVGLWMPSNTRICNYAITVGEYQHWQINLNDSDEVVIDNVLKAHTHPTTPAECWYPVYLFGRNVANALKSGSCSKMRLATWMVCDGSGNFIQKGLPVRVGTGSTWEGAMMDVLTRRIYRNAGTGTFTFGNDLKYPIPAS